jgi:uncharacterized membrane protein
MNSNTGPRAPWIACVGRCVFAAAMIAIGINGLLRRDFDVVWQPVPKWVPIRELWVYLCALVPLVSGLGLIWRRTVAFASQLLLGYCLLWLLLVRLPDVFLRPSIGTAWAICKIAVIAAAAWSVFGGSGVRIARVLYGLSMIVFGAAHFMYLNATAPLVPAWLPWHVAWAYITGATFIAAGIAMIIGVLAGLAAALSALQMGLFTLLIWLPVVIAGNAKPSDWGEFIVSCVLTACGWAVADAYRNFDDGSL